MATNNSVFPDALQQGASQFEQQAGKLKRKFWLQNLKVSIGRNTSAQTKPQTDALFPPTDDDNHGNNRFGHINYHCQ